MRVSPKRNLIIYKKWGYYIEIALLELVEIINTREFYRGKTNSNKVLHCSVNLTHSLFYMRDQNFS